MQSDRDETQLSSRVARLMRHEVGDLLQSVYSTTAVLLDRLPASMFLERKLMAELKSCAELCKTEVDAAVELATLPQGESEVVDLRALFEFALAQARSRYPSLPMDVAPIPATLVQVEPHAASNSCWLLLRSMCQLAKKRLIVRFEQASRHVLCTIERDGYSIPAEQLDWLQTPFATTQQATFGLGLAWLSQAIRPAGRVEAENCPEGGVIVRVFYPISHKSDSSTSR